MADVTIVPSGYSNGGVAGALQEGVNVNDDYYIENHTGGVILIVDSADTTTERMITITTGKTVGPGLAIADQTEALPTTANMVSKFGPFDPDLYNDATGRLHFEFDATDAAIRFHALSLR